MATQTTTTPTVTVDAPEAGQVEGMLGELAHPGELMDAAKAARAAGYTHYDVFSPFPIHHMDRAMGLKNSPLGYFVILGGMTGTCLALLMIWWMNDFDYAVNISNKPLFAIEPSVPIAFELTVLFAALTALFGMLALNKMPRPYNPLFYSKNFERATDDAFFLYLEASDPQFDPATATAFLEKIGATNIETIYDADTPEGEAAE